MQCIFIIPVISSECLTCLTGIVRFMVVVIILGEKKISKGWIFVTLTCIFELLWIYGFNAAENPLDFVLIALIIITDFYFLEKACETIQTGTVYAIFSAIGTIFTALMDTFLFQVEFSWAKGIFITLLIAGVITLKLAENSPDGTEKEKK